MELSDIPTPAVTRGPGWPILTATRIAVGAAFFRTMVWLMTGDGKDYDDFVEVPTPGLGVGRVRCAVCLPPKADQASKELQAPLVLVLQGGGFVLGQPEDGQQHDRKIADELGAVVISVDYAKSPRYPYPHALLQVYEVLKWALSDAAKARNLQIDPSRVAVMGNSAGGNLTAALSLLLSFNSGPNQSFRESLPRNFQQKAQILLYPSVELATPYGDRYLRATPDVQAQSLPIGVAELMEDSYLPPYINRNQLFIAPAQSDTALLRGLNLPRALVLTAGKDCLKQEAETYAKMLTDAGVGVDLHDYPLAVHGFSHYTKGKDFRPEDVQDCWKKVHQTLRSAFEIPA